MFSHLSHSLHSILITTLISDVSLNALALVLPICGDNALGEAKPPASQLCICCSRACPLDGKAGISVEFTVHLQLITNPRVSA